MDLVLVPVLTWSFPTTKLRLMSKGKRNTVSWAMYLVEAETPKEKKSNVLLLDHMVLNSDLLDSDEVTRN